MDKRMSLRISVTLLVCFSLMSGCLERKSDKKHESSPVKVGIAVVGIGDIERPLVLSGDLTFKADAKIATRVSGQVTSLEVEDGQFVKKGQVLIKLDATEIRDMANAARADLNKHTAALEFAKSEYEKNKDLLESGSVSWIDFDRRAAEYRTASAQVEVDKALLARAEQDLRWTEVVSPIDGVLAKRWVDVGDWVARGQKVFEISDYSEIYLKAFLPDKDVERLKRAARGKAVPKVEVIVDALPNKPLTGRITYIAPAAERGKVFEVRAYIDNPDMTLRQGMFARARVVPERISNVLRVPVTALLGKIRDNSTNTVFLVDKDGRVRLTMITIGSNDDVHAQVRQGLNKGDKVVVYGKEVLSTGTRVEPADFDARPQ